VDKEQKRELSLTEEAKAGAFAYLFFDERLFSPANHFVPRIVHSDAG
jgi:hypothetical protein